MRTLSEIYASAKEYRNQYLELTEFQNDSKMSIIDAFTWMVSACIWAFENILEVFQTDVAADIQNRVNGTPSYYANALLKYQSGDKLEMNEEGTIFSYPSVDESKQIITKVSYQEAAEQGYFDQRLILKVATGEPGAYERISAEELTNVRAYIRQIAFAGTHITVVSRKGDVLVPKVTVYYDGAVSQDEVYNNIEVALNDFIEKLDFNGVVYVQKIIDAIQKAEHVVDVYIDSTNNQGIYVSQYNDDDEIGTETLVTRSFVPNSGFIKESTRTGAEAELLTWREAITLTIES